MIPDYLRPLTLKRHRIYFPVFPRERRKEFIKRLKEVAYVRATTPCYYLSGVLFITFFISDRITLIPWLAIPT